MVINNGATTTTTVHDEDPASEHSKPSVRICKVDKGRESGSCGFHLTRTKWDPYPWIAGVDDGSPAQAAGLRVGDCLLEVNGEDVLGLKVGQIATKVLAAPQECIAMLLWNAGSDANCDTESLCCTPMPTSLSRLSSCLSSILSFLECPICFEIISPPAHQCPLGHLICFRCRVYIDRCPICRTGFTRERSLLADQIYNSIIEAFHLNHNSTSERTRKLWERVFGRKKRTDRSEKNSQPSTPKMGIRSFDIKNKFLTRLIGKSSSVDNLSNESMFSSGGPALRKKSISSTDLYTPTESSLKKLSSLHNSNQGSMESFSIHDNNGGGGCGGEGNLSRYSKPNSCETLNVPRNQYFKRLRNRNLNSSFKSSNHNINTTTADNTENLFQFSSEANPNDDSLQNDAFYCPLSQECDTRTAFSLLTHLQEHDGPVIQYFKPNFTVHFPFSFENSAVFIVHCYEKTFYTKLNVDETAGGDIKVYFWIMDRRIEADQFKLKVILRNDQSNALLEFKTVANSIRSTEITDDVYRHQILITKSTLLICFGDKFYSLDLHLKKRRKDKSIL